MDSNLTEFLNTHANEAVKQYQMLDPQGRVSKVFTAKSKSAHGEPCMVCEFIYPDLISTVIKGRKEGLATWDSTWVPDSVFTVSVGG